jgi:hypothetical protein
MLCREDYRSNAPASLQGVARGDSGLGDTEPRSGLLRFVLWLLRGESESPASLSVRVFYKFDSGSWRMRSTHQLQKVYRCR